jgi:acyl-CoA thioester hydrolase
VQVHPHHTDYAGVVWHGTYLAWMEEAREQCLRHLGVNFADLVALGCALPVVELSIRYHRSIRMGESAVVRTRMNEMEGARIHWDYEIVAADAQVLHVTARVTLVAVDQEQGKILRRLPPQIEAVMLKRSSAG